MYVERAREREREGDRAMLVYICICIYNTDMERERGKNTSRETERERESREIGDLSRVLGTLQEQENDVAVKLPCRSSLAHTRKFKVLHSHGGWGQWSALNSNNNIQSRLTSDLHRQPLPLQL